MAQQMEPLDRGGSRGSCGRRQKPIHRRQKPIHRRQNQSTGGKNNQQPLSLLAKIQLPSEPWEPCGQNRIPRRALRLKRIALQPKCNPQASPVVEKQLPCEPCVQNVITRRALRTRDPLLYILHNFILFNSLDQSKCVCLNQNMDISELSF